MSQRDREHRRIIAEESPLNPLSLVGSWMLHEDTFITLGFVVGEPQPGVYLIECYDLVTEQPTHQIIRPLAVLVKDEFSFYDDRASVRRAMFEAVST